MAALIALATFYSCSVADGIGRESCGEIGRQPVTDVPARYFAALEMRFNANALWNVPETGNKEN